jgi:hypothetical protein
MQTQETTIAGRVAEQTEIRRALLRNGYVPLANRDKRCLLKNWPRIAVTGETIDEWADQYRHVSTGVRIEGGLIALDFDIDDHGALDAIWLALPKRLRGLLNAMPRRQGGGAKACLFARREGDTRPMDSRSGTYSRPGETATHRLEMFTGEHPRQMGVFGAHTLDADGGVQRAYRWRGLTLLDVPLADLPTISTRDMRTLRQTVTQVLDRLGWTHDAEAALKARGTSRTVHDLTPEMVFDTEAYGRLSRDDLEEACRASAASLRLSASFTDKGAANRTRCMASIGHDGRVNVHDFMHDRNHRPVECERRAPTPVTIARLNELMKGVRS